MFYFENRERRASERPEEEKLKKGETITDYVKRMEDYVKRRKENEEDKKNRDTSPTSVTNDFDKKKKTYKTGNVMKGRSDLKKKGDKYEIETELNVKKGLEPKVKKALKKSVDMELDKQFKGGNINLDYDSTISEEDEMVNKAMEKQYNRFNEYQEELELFDMHRRASERLNEEEKLKKGETVEDFIKRMKELKERRLKERKENEEDKKNRDSSPTSNNLLKKYKYDTKILNITNKNIEGILDLSKFKYLEELDCSNNEINEIINIPTNFNYLNCSNNKITSLLNLPDEMTGLNCKKNKLKELYYPFNIKPKKYPSNLTHLKFGNNFINPIDNLPNSLTHLTLGYRFNNPIDNLPSSITHLKICGNFNNPIDNLPNSLTHLKLGYRFNHPIDNLPSSITHLTLGNDFNQPIDNLPKSLKINYDDYIS